MVLPRAPRPIVAVGAGGIMRLAHLPAYRKAGFMVSGVYDLDAAAARALAADFAIPTVFGTLADATRVAAVFDVAVPADQVLPVLECLHPGSTVLIQKPLGRNLDEARAIAKLCRRKRLTAAVNFQLRFAPNVLLLRHAVARGLLGELTDIELRTNTHTPWDLWPFLAAAPRLEILYHSIHGLDLIRALCGDPAGVHCWAGRDPRFPDHADTRSTTILRYRNHLRAVVHTNHGHRHPGVQVSSTLKVEGSAASMLLSMGVNEDYGAGRPDACWFATAGEPLQAIRLAGDWFPDAFVGSMAELQRFAAGETALLQTEIRDALRTMALVETCYRSAAAGGTPLLEPA